MHPIRAAAERQPVVVAALAVVVFSTGPVMVAGADVPGAVLSFYRLWFGAVALGVLTLGYVRSSGRTPTRAGWRSAVTCGLVFGCHQLTFMIAIKRTSVVDVTLMQVLQPLVVAALAARIFGEHPGVRFRVWSLIAMAGATAVVLGGSTGPEGDAGGMVLAVLNIVFYSLFFLGSKHSRDRIDVVPFLFGMSTVAAVAVTAYVLVAGEPLGSAGAHDLALATGLALLPGGVGHFLATWPLRWVPANIPPLLQLALPFLAGSLAWLLLDESITLVHVLGGLVTIAGAAGAILSPMGRRMVRREDAALATGTS
jgi:drug/metabolite transporter (DMT)-like permease